MWSEERCVLPRDPQAAPQLLTAFMENIGQISEHCWDDDFGASELFARAWAMAENLAKTLPEKTFAMRDAPSHMLSMQWTF